MRQSIIPRIIIDILIVYLYSVLWLNVSKNKLAYNFLNIQIVNHNLRPKMQGDRLRNQYELIKNSIKKKDLSNIYENIVKANELGLPSP